MAKSRKVTVEGLGVVKLTESPDDNGVFCLTVESEKPHVLSRLIIQATTLLPGVKLVDPERLMFQITARRIGHPLDKVEQILKAIADFATFQVAPPAKLIQARVSTTSSRSVKPPYVVNRYRTHS